MSERTKDQCVSFRTVIPGKNSKGGDRFQLYIGGHAEDDQYSPGNSAIQTLIGALTGMLDNPRGAKLDLHIEQAQTANGRTFFKAYAYVKPTQEAGTSGVVANAQATKKFKAKAAPTTLGAKA